MPLEISSSKVGSITLLSLKGTIVAGNDRKKLQDKIKELLDAAEINIIMDLEQVSYADSTGIGGLLEASTAATRKGGCAVLLHLTKRIHDVLQITRLSTVFGIYDDLQKAVDSFGSTG
ncbi:MAG TPA: STAS domain-containing protein [Terriglobia bacterium]|nr:STAS domain-containing protein [Terriglobia bacterium]